MLACMTYFLFIYLMRQTVGPIELSCVVGGDLFASSPELMYTLGHVTACSERMMHGEEAELTPDAHL